MFPLYNKSLLTLFLSLSTNSLCSKRLPTSSRLYGIHKGFSNRVYIASTLNFTSFFYVAVSLEHKRLQSLADLLQRFLSLCHPALLYATKRFPHHKFYSQPLSELMAGCQIKRITFTQAYQVYIAVFYGLHLFTALHATNVISI